MVNMRLKRCLVCFCPNFCALNFLAAGPMRTPLFITLGPLQLFTTLPATDSNTTPHIAMTSQLWLSASNLAWPPQRSAGRSLAFKFGASPRASPYLLLHLRPFSFALLPSVGVVLDLALSLRVVTTIARRLYSLARAAPALLRCTSRTSASKDTTEDEYKQPVSKLFVASASVQHLPAGFPLFVCFNSSKHHRMYLSQPADVHSAQLNTFSGNDGAGEVWAVGDKMVKSCDILARSCSKGVFGGNGVLQSALCVTFSSAPAFVITCMTH